MLLNLRFFGVLGGVYGAPSSTWSSFDKKGDLPTDGRLWMFLATGRLKARGESGGEESGLKSVLVKDAGMECALLGGVGSAFSGKFSILALGVRRPDRVAFGF